jgi:signal transduction histidine kinase
MSSKRVFMVAAVASVAVVGLEAAWLVSGLGGGKVVQGGDDILLTAAPLWAGLICARLALKRNDRERKAWALIAAAAMSWGIGQAIWTVYEVGLGRAVPFPSAADAGYLALIPLAAAGMLFLRPAPGHWPARARMILDGLIIAGSLLSVAEDLLLGQMFSNGSGSAFKDAIGLAYPLGDVVILTILLSISTRSRRGTRLPFALVLAGLGSLALADSSFSYLTSSNTYATGNLIDLGWLGGFLLIGLAALSRGRGEALLAADVRNPGRNDDRPSKWGLVVPYVAILVALITATREQIREGRLDNFTYILTAILIVLVVTRLLIVLRENFSLNHELDEKVDSRTAELESALGRLREAGRLQDEFIANVSHELRTPLTTIVGVSRALTSRDFGLDENGRNLVEMASRSADRMNRLVEDLLIASGISQGLGTSQTYFDLHSVVVDAVQESKDSGRIEAPGPAVNYLGDPAAVRSILGHLISNAEKFTPEGRVQVSIGRRPGWIDLCIQDEGPGIPEALHERIFDRFFQVDGSTTREQGGAGLGLYISRKLAEGLGGTLTLESSSKDGSVFKLSLPTPGVLSDDGAESSAESRGSEVVDSAPFGP